MRLFSQMRLAKLKRALRRSIQRSDNMKKCLTMMLDQADGLRDWIKSIQEALDKKSGEHDQKFKQIIPALNVLIEAHNKTSTAKA